ncbi:MAG: hypothetical protein IPJ57_14800 [Gemmatimonadetes bacterium]|nr:hypothetical protein [Gemmatimonadota bacterium]
MTSLSLRILSRGRWEVSLGGTVKLPLADTAHYGTGQWDVGGSASVSVRLGPGTVAGGDLSWWYLGDLPELDLKNPLGGSVSLTHLVGGRWGVSAFARASSSVVPGFTAPASIGGGIARLGAAGMLGLEVSAGLSETSPDLGLTGYWRLAIH